MNVQDKARNTPRANFTEIIRFETMDTESVAQAIARADFNGDGRVAFGDFLFFTSVFGNQQGQANFDSKFDLDGDSSVRFSDFLIFVDFYVKPVSS